jgi:hypothetical protein
MSKCQNVNFKTKSIANFYIKRLNLNLVFEFPVNPSLLSALLIPRHLWVELAEALKTKQITIIFI